MGMGKACNAETISIAMLVNGISAWILGWDGQLEASCELCLAWTVYADTAARHLEALAMSHESVIPGKSNHSTLHY